jgi:hypothetical protein
MEDATQFAVSITPKKANSAIILEATVSNEAHYNAMFLFLRRFTDSTGGDTYLSTTQDAGVRSAGIAPILYDGHAPSSTMTQSTVKYVDFPNEARPITYFLIYHSVLANQCVINRTTDHQNQTNREIGMSMFTATEIAQ